MSLPRMLLDEGFHPLREMLDQQTLADLLDACTALAPHSQRGGIRNVLSHSPVIAAFSRDARILSHLAEDFRPVRCILFDKTPESNWPVAWHQDLTIAVREKTDIPSYTNWSVKDGVVHVQPPIELLESMVTVRIHLDDTPAENGALKVIPRSHLYGRIESQETARFLDQDAITCECSAGDILLMKPLILHTSERSRTPAHRRVIHIEYAQRDQLHPDLEWYEE